MVTEKIVVESNEIVLHKENRLNSIPLQKLPDHIKEYLNNRDGSSEFIELFQSNNDDFDLKTHLSKSEIVVSNIIMMNDNFMKSKGCFDNIYGNFIQQYSRLRVSLDRLSRSEFVNINKRDHLNDNLNTIGQFDALKKLKE